MTYLFIITFLFNLNGFSEITRDFGHTQLISTDESQTTQDNFNTINQIIERVHQKIPAEIANKIKREKLIIRLDTTINRDGLYFPPSQNIYSSHLISLNINRPMVKSDAILLVHEYFHFIHYLYNPGELSWIKEGLAEVFVERIYNYRSIKNIKQALITPSTPLEVEFNINEKEQGKYGNSYLFFDYLFYKCALDDYFWQYVTQPLPGREGLNLFLNKFNKNKCHNFNEVAENYSFAKIINEKTTNQEDEDKYFLTNFTKYYPIKEPANLKSFQPYYLFHNLRHEIYPFKNKSLKIKAIDRSYYPSKVWDITINEVYDLSKTTDIAFIITD